ncbi:MAG: sigma-70 family RNA polymerase sigma factor [Bacteroidales bacterium]|nr:sigma-70 family RNA polymerase sigma factor [Bacteroidales bacterium]
MELHQFKEEALPVRGKILNYALKMLESRDEAEDTVQEVLLKLWEMRAKLSEYDSVEALAVTMTKNICLNKISYRQRHGREVLSQIQSVWSNETVERQIENADAVDWVKQIIETLPPLQKTIIKMRDIEDYELNTIAEITGCTEEAVRMNLSRARKKVKEVFFKINKTN